MYFVKIGTTNRCAHAASAVRPTADTAVARGRIARYLLILFITAFPAAGQNEPDPTRSRGPSGEGGKAIEFASPELARLDIFVGPWSVTESHFNPRGEVIATVKGTEEITWILDHRAIRRAYSTSTGTTVFKANGTLTWNDVEKKYHGAWFDNVSTAGPTTAMGSWDDETKTMLFHVESSGRDGSTVRYRVVERFTDPQTRVATTYLLEGSNLVKRMEVEYKRATPCPAKAITILGG